VSTWFKSTPESEALLAEERLVLAATELVYEAMEMRGVSKKELARRLNVRPTEISQRLKGTRNMTLRSLASMLHQLDASADLSLRLRDAAPARTTIRQTSQFSGSTGGGYIRRPPLRAISGAAA